MCSSSRLTHSSDIASLFAQPSNRNNLSKRGDKANGIDAYSRRGWFTSSSSPSQNAALARANRCAAIVCMIDTLQYSPEDFLIKKDLLHHHETARWMTAVIPRYAFSISRPMAFPRCKTHLMLPHLLLLHHMTGI